MYIQTTATKKICSLTKRIRAVSGGTSASKTISILIWLIGYCQHKDVKNEIVSVVSETLPHLKRGAIRDFINIMQEHGYYKDERWNRTDFIYTFETGTKLEFFSADQPGKVRGPRRDVLFINEANNVSYETFTQLEIRTKKMIWLDWNPVSEFWFYTDEMGNPNVIGRPDVDFITLTYKDNEALDREIVLALENRRQNSRWWKVYGEGQLGEAEGRIYIGWQLIDEIPHEARLEGYGLDFGYSNDPTAILAIYRYNGGYLFDEVSYIKGLSNKQIADLFLNRGRALVIADSAEPKSIDEIAAYGISITAALKGQGSILQGIQFVQDQQISVTKRSLNIIREYRNYLWMVNDSGNNVNEPSGTLNHMMDAIRYGMSRYFIDYQATAYHLPDAAKILKTGATSVWGGVPFDLHS